VTDIHPPYSCSSIGSCIDVCISLTWNDVSSSNICDCGSTLNAVDVNDAGRRNGSMKIDRIQNVVSVLKMRDRTLRSVDGNTLNVSVSTLSLSLSPVDVSVDVDVVAVAVAVAVIGLAMMSLSVFVWGAMRSISSCINDNSLCNRLLRNIPLLLCRSIRKGLGTNDSTAYHLKRFSSSSVLNPASERATIC
jgi:hypothetical protein